MKVELRTVDIFEKAEKRTKPVDYFKKCPKCGDCDLIHFIPDVLCSSCDWDSLAWDVSRGGMDDLNQAAKETFIPKPTQLRSQCKMLISKKSAADSDDQSTEAKKGA
ncbi:MAG: hypothetical protein ACOYOK_00200 [Pseudobdellovibrionaceae bacterium]